MIFQGEFTDKQKNILYFLLLFLVFLWHLPLMTIFLPGEDNLDPSWMKTLHYAAENHLSFGKDFIFTYGPLGYLFRPMNKTVYFFTSLLNIIFLFSLKDLFFFKDKRDLVWKSVFAVFTLFSTLHDLFYLFFPFLLLGRAGKKLKKKNISFLLFLTGMGAVCVYMKFTFFPVVLFSVILADIRLFLKNKRCFLLGAFLLFLPLIWVLIGQKIEEYGNFFLYSFEIMDGFNKSMSSYCAPIEYFYLTLSLVFFLWATFVFYFLRKEKEFSLYEKILFSVAGALPLFVSYKYAVVRMDAGHLAGGWLNLSLFAAYLFCKEMPEKVIDGELLLRAGLCMAALGLPFMIMTKQLPHFHKEVLKKASFQNISSFFQKPVPLRDDKGEYRGKSCDLFAYGEFDTLHKMGFIYRPRPVMQSYSAYTEKLMKRNQTHTAEAKTDFLLFRLEKQDNRYPMAADHSLLPLCGKYVPEKLFQGNRGELLLMKKDPDGKEKQLKKIWEKKILPGEEIFIPPHDTMLYISFDIQYSLSGKLFSLFWRTPPPLIKLVTARGDHLSFELIPAMAQTPFLLSPYLRTTSDFASLWEKDEEKRKKILTPLSITKFHIDFTARLFSKSVSPWDEKVGKRLYDPSLNVTLYQVPF